MATPPWSITQQGAPIPTYTPNPVAKAPLTPGVPGTTNVGGMLQAKPGDTSFAGKDDTIVTWPDGHKTVLMKSGQAIDVPAPAAEGGGGHAAGPSKPSMPAPASANKPTKVIGPKNLKDLLPAFSPAAFNQFPYFYSSDQYVPASQLQGSLKNLGGQQAIADMLGVNWDGGYTLNLPPGGGQQMPKSSLTESWVDPRVYGYAAPILNQAMYQSARSTAK